MADERMPWEQVEGESNRWFQRFNAYRLLGPWAQPLETVNQERVAKGLQKARQSAGSWRRAAELFSWKSRAEAWDRSVVEEADARWQAQIMGEAELLARLSQMARANIGDFLELGPNGHIRAIKLADKGHLVKKISSSEGKTDSVSLEMYDAQGAMQMLGKHLRLFEKDDHAGQDTGSSAVSMPADLLAPQFLSVYRDIRDKRHSEYVLYGGRGSTKSSFISLAIIWLLMNYPNIHALATRQVKDTLRDSVYAQLVWAISELGVDDQFKCTTSPLEITYLPTGQRIYFRGADNPGKIKSIKPRNGYIAILWFEELDQFKGPEAVRKIEQSVIRGGDAAFIFKSFNPPRTQNNWANKYVKTPKPTQLQHRSTYLDVPPEWLGKAFLDEAEFLKSVNPDAYEHEYLGVANSAGGLVFENVQLRAITDEEIAQFDHVTWGGDWGYYPDPADMGPVHFDAARRTLYIFGEYRAWKQNNLALFEALVRDHGLKPEDLLILDSAEPKSIADFVKYSADGVSALDENGDPKLDARGKPILLYGPTCRGAEKGPESVKYSIKWLQGLTAIIIDPSRCPYAAEEFISYEYEQDPDGNFISEYPDRDNHSIDRVRYGTNLIWRRRGQ